MGCIWLSFAQELIRKNHIFNYVLVGAGWKLPIFDIGFGVSERITNIDFFLKQSIFNSFNT